MRPYSIAVAAQALLTADTAARAKRFTARVAARKIRSLPGIIAVSCRCGSTWDEIRSGSRVGCRLNDPILRGDLPVERRGELRRALLRGIVHVQQAEAGAVAVGPFEIVHQAPMEIAAHRHALGGRAL